MKNICDKANKKTETNVNLSFSWQAQFLTSPPSTNSIYQKVNQTPQTIDKDS